MIGIILGIVGLAGGGGLAALIARFGLKVVLGNAGSLFKRVPRWAWIALAVAVLLVAGYLYHQHRAHAAIAAAKAEQKKADDAAWQTRFEAMREKAVAVRVKAETLGRKISTTLKDQHDAQVRRNAFDARDLQLRGPGKAAVPAGCGPVNYPGFSAAAGRPERPGGAAGAAADSLPAKNGLSGLPAERFGIVPWSWLVDVGRGSDDSSDEALKWRSWYAQQLAAWEQMRRSTPAKH